MIDASRIGRWLDLCVTVLMGLVAVSLLLPTLHGAPPRPGNDVKPLPNLPVALQASATYGGSERIILMFTDFECPACKKWHDEQWPVFKSLPEAASVELILKHLPLAGHQNARKSAETALCLQAEIWLRLDNLYSSPQAVNGCSSAAMALAQDIELASTLGVTGTPTFVIGRRRGTNAMTPLYIYRGVTAAADLVKAALK